MLSNNVVSFTQNTIVGEVLSINERLNVHDVELPASSIAEITTEVDVEIMAPGIGN